ncbi:MAG: 2Fe-2S iron-sulfur cluster-binding protein [Gammaproteobacteria bacterium]|nr:2Fe-2S iron-sulfur cluster-binding protein [Gammaproteobacteria bacterium]
MPSGHEFVVEANEPLLEAALRSGLALEHGCVNGACGECRARVREGRVRQVRFHDYVIREADKRDGMVLLCCCTADGDLTIEAREASDPRDIPEQQVRARVYRQDQVSNDVQIVHLRVMRGKSLRFFAGQHASLALSGCASEDVPIASCPCDGLNLEFHFHRGQGGELSNRAFRGFSRSDRFDIRGPRGTFTLDENSSRPLVFLAHDTGIAPVKSIIEHAINLELPQAIHLQWHATGPQGHYLHNYFRSLADALDDFRYLPVEGPLRGDMIAGLPGPDSADAYVAGGGEFVAAGRDMLLAGGVPEDRLFIDVLGGDPPAPKAG